MNPGKHVHRGDHNREKTVDSDGIHVHGFSSKDVDNTLAYSQK